MTLNSSSAVWIFRVYLSINECCYIGDAEMKLDAADGTNPVSCGQTSAVGQALEFAGFGDIKAVLAMTGQNKDPQGLEFPPQLASANAVMRARQQRGTQGVDKTPPEKTTLHTAAQREQIETLCSRLGVPEPVYETLSAVEADQRIADLQAEEADLLMAVDAERKASPQPSSSPQTPSTPGKVVDRAMVRHLKQRWRSLGQPTDALAEWRAFKARICQKEVSDDSLSAEHYEALVVALDQIQAQSAPPAVQSSRRQGQGSAPVRQAPRFSSASPTVTTHEP